MDQKKQKHRTETVAADKPAVSQPWTLHTKLEEWEDLGVKCYYARFHQPVPPYVNVEPVSEFKLIADQRKYKVDRITFTENGVIWRANGEVNIVPLANVIYVRPILVDS